MEEVWKDIEWHKGAYKISNLGRVYSVQRKKIKNTFIDKGGYVRVQLYHNYPQVNHIDENKLNNCVDNLEWCTNKYNCNFGTKPEKSRKNSSKLQLNKRSVAIYDSENNYIDTCKSMMDVARKLNCSYSNVQSVLYLVKDMYLNILNKRHKHCIDILIHPKNSKRISIKHVKVKILK
jgi:hypothetical protein